MKLKDVKDKISIPVKEVNVGYRYLVGKKKVLYGGFDVDATTGEVSVLQEVYKFEKEDYTKMHCNIVQFIHENINTMANVNLGVFLILIEATDYETNNIYMSNALKDRLYKCFPNAKDPQRLLEGEIRKLKNANVLFSENIGNKISNNVLFVNAYLFTKCTTQIRLQLLKKTELLLNEKGNKSAKPIPEDTNL